MSFKKIIYVFFTLMSLTTTAGFLYETNVILLFIAAVVNVLSTILKIGVKNILSAELFAGSLVADLHLIPAFFALEMYHNEHSAIGLAIGAVIANFFCVVLILIETIKHNSHIDYDEY